MTTIERRLSKLEQGNQPAVHRPPGMSSDEFAGLMNDAIARLPEGTPDIEFSRIMAPYLASMTHTELSDLLAAMDAELLNRGVSTQGAVAHHGRRSA